ncbi:hypothetical protein AXFE_13270 [Acidithrix ferrooxidans]|uniref:Uncharacterized protein n=1 Tax=Acidithrix ferrooxidans TaxID=1280514 RepID=A0A0D8HIQ9_9ACTN|nr:hypothetical protein AXFE_13270 [Acidithrix ferrooxidans]
MGSNIVFSRRPNILVIFLVEFLSGFHLGDVISHLFFLNG